MASSTSNNLLVHLKHCFSAPSLRSYLAEFISTFLFVFTAAGSAISARTSLRFHFHAHQLMQVFYMDTVFQISCVATIIARDADDAGAGR